MEDKYIKTHIFIKNKWKDGLRDSSSSNPEYPLPFPFEPPCVDGLFKCLFYWDTFYTNKGMILDGHADWAKYNVDNLIYLLKKYGCVPNSNSYPGIKHNSQPPYLHYMVKDIYEVIKDDEWLKEAYFALKIEYNFWMTKRMTPTGLNQYLHHKKTEQEYLDFYDYVCTRLDLDKNAPLEEKIKAASGLNADCESGLDFSPRFALDGKDIIEPDLNAHLYAMENNLALWARKFEPEMEEIFLAASKKRKELMDKYLLNKEDGLYYDYNFVKKDFQQLEFSFTGQFVPFFTGVSSDKKALKHLLNKVEFEYGIASTGKYTSPYVYQAAYPYSWPYDNGLAFWALKEIGMEEDIQRMGMKYLTMCANSYTIAGHLWETYDATKDGIAEKKEYPNKEMLGWTAGIYQWIYYYLNK